MMCAVAFRRQGRKGIALGKRPRDKFVHRVDGVFLQRQEVTGLVVNEKVNVTR